MSRLTERLDRWVWTLIYGGLLLMGLGLAIWSQPSSWPLWLVLGGGLAAAVGLVLIAIRSRQSDA